MSRAQDDSVDKKKKSTNCSSIDHIKTTIGMIVTESNADYLKSQLSQLRSLGDDHRKFGDNEQKQALSSSGYKRKSLEKTEIPTKKTFSIQLNNLKPKSKKEETVVKQNVKLSAFNEDSDSEEEMPLECRMKMRNIGRDTITSAGPKSYNKGKQGFTNNAFKQFELSMKPRNSMEKQNDFKE